VAGPINNIVAFEATSADIQNGYVQYIHGPMENFLAPKTGTT
jgi:hypothetical protein